MVLPVRVLTKLRFRNHVSDIVLPSDSNFIHDIFSFGSFLIAERTGFDGLWGVEKDLHLHCKIREKYIVSSSLSITNGNRKKALHYTYWLRFFVVAG